MKKYQLLMSLVLFFSSSSVFAAVGAYQKIEKCIIIYDRKASEGKAFINLKNIDELLIEETSVKLIFGNNLTILAANKKQQEDIIEAFKRCGEF